MKYYFTVFSLVLVCCIGVTQADTEKQSQSLPHPDLGKFKSELITITNLNKLAPKDGEYLLEGYVVWMPDCPPCPPNAVCERCVRTMYVSEINLKYDPDRKSDDTVVFYDQSGFFEVGEKYLFHIKIVTEHNIKGSYTSLRIVDYSKVES